MTVDNDIMREMALLDINAIICCAIASARTPIRDCTVALTAMHGYFCTTTNIQQKKARDQNTHADPTLL